MKKIGLKTFFLIILASTIALSPSFSFGRLEDGKAIEIRAEDILLVFLGLIWLAGVLISGKERFERPPLFFPIFAWITVGVLSVLTNWIFRNIELWRGFFFLLKEVEFFFLYFYLFYHISKIDTIKFLVRVWIFLGAINVAWIIFELITGSKITYYYGPTIFAEPQGTHSSGALFLILFAFFINNFIYYSSKSQVSLFKKIALLVLIILLPIGIITSGSRSVFMGFIASLFFTAMFYSIKKRFFIKFSTGVLIMMAVLLFLGQSFLAISNSNNNRIFSSTNAINRVVDINGFIWEFASGHSLSRVGVWKTQLSEVARHPFFTLFGFGKGAVVVYGESHSQYIRNFVEVGLVGSLVFFLLIFAMIKKSWLEFFKGTDAFLKGMSVGLIVATLSLLVTSITVEAFILVKIAEVYWFFASLTLTAIVLSKQKIIKQQS